MKRQMVSRGSKRISVSYTHLDVYKRQMQSRKTGEFLQLYQKLAEAGLTPLVVKGLVCRSLYREPDYRASGDEDILIPAEQFPECSRIFAAVSYTHLDVYKRQYWIGFVLCNKDCD